MNPYQNQNPPPDSSGSRKQPEEGQQPKGGAGSWMNHPSLGGIDPARLQMLASLASQAQSKKQNELLPFLMAAASQSGSGQMSFDNDEISAIIQVLKLGKTQQEIQQIDRLCALVKQLRQSM